MNEGYEVDAGRKQKRMRWTGWLITAAVIMVFQAFKVFGS